MNQLKLYSQSLISEDHIIVVVKVGFCLKHIKVFTEGVVQLIDIIGFGNSKRYKDEDSILRENYTIKVITYDENLNDYNVDNYSTKGVISFAVPITICTIETGIPQIISTIMYPSVYSFICEYKVIDIEIPEKYLKSLPKPKYGLSIFNNDKKVQLGLILKPRSILQDRLANLLVYKACEGGIDYIIDDELTINPPHWKFEERVSFIMDLINLAKRETGKEVKYIANISGSYKNSLKLAKIAEKYNVAGVMVNAISMGYDVIQGLAKNKNFKPFIVANMLGRDLFTGGRDFLIAPHILSFFSRISGADAIYIGPFIGTVLSKKEQSSKFQWALTDPISKKYQVLQSYAIMSGGITPKNIIENKMIYSQNTMFSMGTSLCSYIENEVNVKNILEIINLILNINENSLDDLSEIILELAKNDRYLTTLKQIGWI